MLKLGRFVTLSPPASPPIARLMSEVDRFSCAWPSHPAGKARGAEGGLDVPARLAEVSPSFEVQRDDGRIWHGLRDVDRLCRRERQRVAACGRDPTAPRLRIAT